MKKYSVLVTLVLADLFSGTCGDDHGLTWDYDGEHGPDHWYEIQALCGGTEQSPINIATSSAVAADYESIYMENGDAIPKKLKIANNGHTVVVSMDMERKPYVSDEVLNTTFSFAQVHFHWGSSVSNGSEHTLDGKRFPAEIHLVHWNTKYKSLSRALGKTDGLLVLGIFVMESESDNPNLFPIIDMLHEVTIAETNTSRNDSEFRLKNILPSDLGQFYRYHGSLTTPDCNEAVYWTVFTTPITASNKQLSKFHELQKLDGTPLINNFRPIQPVASRKVYFRSVASVPASTLFGIALCTLLSLNK
ncbi:carbonic anhydrase 2-like [Artemia franciscana]|uniref:carbonic anhydrase 2-like n=1 Tax=Artemia franciscana TaxID=6661 RepID=UPI0032DB8D35